MPAIKRKIKPQDVSIIHKRKGSKPRSWSLLKTAFIEFHHGKDFPLGFSPKTDKKTETYALRLYLCKITLSFIVRPLLIIYNRSNCSN